MPQSRASSPSQPPLSLALTRTPLVRLIHLKSGDLTSPCSKQNPQDVVLLVIDQKPDAFPEPPLSGTVITRKSSRCAAGVMPRSGPRCSLPPPSSSKAWSRSTLAQAVLAASHPCLSFAATPPGLSPAPVVPLNMAAAALDQMAYVNLRADEDDFIRPSALRPAGARSSRSRRLRSSPGARPSSPACTLIRYAGPAGTFPRLLSDFVAAARAGKSSLLRQWVSGKAVLLGSADRRPPCHALLRLPRGRPSQHRRR